MVNYQIPELVPEPLAFFLFPPIKESAHTLRVVTEPHEKNVREEHEAVTLGSIFQTTAN